MKSISLLLLLSLAIAACEKCDPGEEFYPACSVENPTKELAWLREEIQNREQSNFSYDRYFYITQANYRGETVFIYEGCCPNCNTLVQVFNCFGEQIGTVSPRAEDINYSELTEVIVIWQPENFACVR